MKETSIIHMVGGDELKEANMSQEEKPIHIDTSSIPDYIRDRLAAATLEFYYDLLRQFGSPEGIRAKKAKLDAAKQQNNLLQRIKALEALE